MDCAVLTLILSQDDKPVFLDPKDQFDDLYGPLSIVLAQNEASQAGQESEIEVKDNKSVKDFWKSFYQYKATLLIFKGTEMVVNFLMSVRVRLIRWNGMALTPPALVLPVPMRMLCDRSECGPPGVRVFR